MFIKIQMLILFSINIVKFRIVWLLGKQCFYSFWDEGSTLTNLFTFAETLASFIVWILTLYVRIIFFFIVRVLLLICFFVVPGTYMLNTSYTVWGARSGFEMEQSLSWSPGKISNNRSASWLLFQEPFCSIYN